jgi:hypothetical protein
VLAGSVERAGVADPRRAWRVAVGPGLVVAGDEELLRRQRGRDRGWAWRSSPW